MTLNELISAARKLQSEHHPNSPEFLALDAMVSAGLVVNHLEKKEPGYACLNFDSLHDVVDLMENHFYPVPEGE